MAHVLGNNLRTKKFFFLMNLLRTCFHDFYPKKLYFVSYRDFESNGRWCKRKLISESCADTTVCSSSKMRLCTFSVSQIWVLISSLKYFLQYYFAYRFLSSPILSEKEWNLSFMSMQLIVFHFPWHLVPGWNFFQLLHSARSIVAHCSIFSSLNAKTT